MDRLINPPPMWSVEAVEAFETLMNAIRNYKQYADTLAALGINAGNLITRRNQLRDHILNTLGPAFRDAV